VLLPYGMFFFVVANKSRVVSLSVSCSVEIILAHFSCFCGFSLR
jgi:hypothetical protein